MLIVIIVIAVVVVAVIGGYYYLSLDTDDNGNGNGNGNGSNHAPEAKFDYFPKPVIVNQTVHFDSSNSTDQDGDDLTYEWNFGDPYSEPGNSNTADEANPEHIYRNPGSYKVSLIVDDGRGKNDTHEVTITVEGEGSLTATLTANAVPVGAITWTISITNVEGPNEKTALTDNMYIISNPDETVIRKSGYLSEILDYPTTIPIPAGIYYLGGEDNALSNQDSIEIAGDGDASIQSGDIFKIIYDPPPPTSGPSEEVGRTTLP